MNTCADCSSFSGKLIESLCGFEREGLPQFTKLAKERDFRGTDFAY